MSRPLGLPAGAVQGEHQQRGGTLPFRMLGDELAQHRDLLVMRTQVDAGLGEPLDRVQTLLAAEWRRSRAG